MIRASAATLMLCLLPMTASAQTATGAAPASSQGPMIVERLHSGFLAAPDFKVTEFDHTTSELLGAYAGWLTDDTFFIGGGGYWLVNESHDREMAYGGLVLQWLVHANSRVGFGAKGLIGGGEATLSSTLSNVIVRGDVHGRIDQNDLMNAPIAYTHVHFYEGFFIAEPEADLLLRLTRHLRVTVGAGYRFTAGAHDDSRLHGAVGSIGLQIGGGS